MALGFGTLLYVALLLVNAMAVLSEDRFLARSSWTPFRTRLPWTEPPIVVGWASTPSQAMNAAYNPPYDQNVYGGVQGQAGIKAGMINLLSAVRTVMRSAFALIFARIAASTDVRSAVPLIGLNIVVIIYQLLLG